MFGIWLDGVSLTIKYACTKRLQLLATAAMLKTQHSGTVPGARAA